MLTVYQIILSKAAVDTANKHGRMIAECDFPEYEAYLRLMFGAKDFMATDFMHFTKVATVDANDVEDAFTIMNRWSPEDEAKVTRLDRLHSLSVGDIVEKDGKFFVCDNCGFKEFHIPAFIADRITGSN